VTRKELHYQLPLLDKTDLDRHLRWLERHNLAKKADGFGWFPMTLPTGSVCWEHGYPLTESGCKACIRREKDANTGT
jgi:hypothetical protein